MLSHAETLMQEALKLSQSDRAILADRLYASLSPTSGVKHHEHTDAEIKNRIEALDQDALETLSAREIRSQTTQMIEERSRVQP